MPPMQIMRHVKGSFPVNIQNIPTTSMTEFFYADAE